MDIIGRFLKGKWLKLAQGHIGNPLRMMALLDKVRTYTTKKGVNGVKEQLVLLYHYVTDIAGGKYKQYNGVKLTLVVGALIYLVSPIDVIPDLLLGGLIDDVAIIGWVLGEVSEELAKYKAHVSPPQTEG